MTGSIRAILILFNSMETICSQIWRPWKLREYRRNDLSRVGELLEAKSWKYRHVDTNFPLIRHSKK